MTTRSQSRPRHRHREGKCVCPGVETHCVTDTREEYFVAVIAHIRDTLYLGISIPVVN